MLTDKTEGPPSAARAILGELKNRCRTSGKRGTAARQSLVLTSGTLVLIDTRTNEQLIENVHLGQTVALGFDVGSVG